MSKLNASILIIGNEILSGRTQDINVKYIASKLLKIGISLDEVRIIADKRNEIIKNLNIMRKKYSYVFTTGGIGPTHDDITSESVAKAFKKGYEINKKALNILKKYYPKNKLNDGRIKMTKMPRGAKLIKNPLTLAPGFVIENVYVLPGVPLIMQKMFDNLIKSLKINNPIISKTINTSLFESIIAKSLDKIQKKYNNCEIGSYPSFDIKRKVGNVNIVVSGTNKQSINFAVEEIKLSIKKLKKDFNNI